MADWHDLRVDGDRLWQRLEALGEIGAVHGPSAAQVDGQPGEIVTLLPIGGAAHGITTSGLQYELSDADLDVGTTRGVSNVLQSSVATVSLRSGSLLIIRPFAVTSHPAP